MKIQQPSLKSSAKVLPKKKKKLVEERDLGLFTNFKKFRKRLTETCRFLRNKRYNLLSFTTALKPSKQKKENLGNVKISANCRK